MTMHLDPKTQSRILLRAMGIMLPIVLALLGLLTILMGDDTDLYMIGTLLALVGAGWLLYGLFRLAKRSSGDDWPSGDF